jgi:hypothetical protein
MKRILLLALLLGACHKSTPTATLNVMVASSLTGDPLANYPGVIEVSLYRNGVLFQQTEMNLEGMATFTDIPEQAYEITAQGPCGGGEDSTGVISGVSGTEVFYTPVIGCLP